MLTLSAAINNRKPLESERVGPTIPSPSEGKGQGRRLNPNGIPSQSQGWQGASLPLSKWRDGITTPTTNVQALSHGRIRLRRFALSCHVRCLSEMHRFTLSSWMSRREAAVYLSWTLEQVDRTLVPLGLYPAQITGKMRYELMERDCALRVRILAADVYSFLPLAPQAGVAVEARMR